MNLYRADYKCGCWAICATETAQLVSDQGGTCAEHKSARVGEVRLLRALEPGEDVRAAAKKEATRLIESRGARIQPVG